MAVYVDNAHIRWRGSTWCHLQADTLDELHQFAQGIGLNREWFQPGSRPAAAHYDVAASYRTRAIAAGAISETMREGSLRRRGGT